MQVLHWLFRVTHDQKSANESKVEEKSSGKVVRYNNKEKRVSKRGGKAEETAIDCKNFRYLALSLKRGNTSRALFYRTLDHQKRPSSKLNHNYRQKQQHFYINYSMKMKKDHDHHARGLGLGHHLNNKSDVGNKVLPISDSSTSSSNSSNGDDQKKCGPSDHQKIKDKVKVGDEIIHSSNGNNKAKTLSRMKELLRWAAAAKSEKLGAKFGRKVLHFRNRSATIKSGRFEEESNYDSPKISFRWEVESVSTTCSAPPCLKYNDHHQLSAHKSGNWITTDDEFVVLEL